MVNRGVRPSQGVILRGALGLTLGAVAGCATPESAPAQQRGGGEDIGVAASAAQTCLTIQRGLAGSTVRDTQVSSVPANQNTNFGAATTVSVGVNAGKAAQGLFKFD